MIFGQCKTTIQGPAASSRGNKEIRTNIGGGRVFQGKKGEEKINLKEKVWALRRLGIK